MRRLIVLTALVLMGLAMLPAAPTEAQDTRCFRETGQCISGAIRRYWEQNGGLPVFGFPITAVQIDTIEGWTGPVQWFERDRLEDHSNEGKGVLAGRLGVERLAQQGRPWQFRQLGNPVPGCRGFPETGYYLCGGFLTFWERNGGLNRFGFPVTDQISENLGGREFTVQYFERRRMEFHPENRPPFDILLGLLGNEIRTNAQPPPPPPTATPVPPVVVSQQIRIDEPGENSVISTPVRIGGRTTLMPPSGALAYRVSEPNGNQLGSGTITVNRQTDGSGAFSSTIAYSAPFGNNVVIELTDRDPRGGGVIARAVRNVRYAPTTAQVITLDQPVSGSRVGTRLRVSGSTLLYPSEGDLIVSVIDGRGAFITSFPIGVTGSPGTSTTFLVDFDIPDQLGALVTVEVSDRNTRGDVIARVQANVFAGSSPYPGPRP